MTARESLLEKLTVIRQNLVEAAAIVLADQDSTSMAYVGGHIGSMVAVVERTRDAVRNTI